MWACPPSSALTQYEHVHHILAMTVVLLIEIEDEMGTETERETERERERDRPTNTYAGTPRLHLQNEYIAPLPNQGFGSTEWNTLFHCSWPHSTKLDHYRDQTWSETTYINSGSSLYPATRRSDHGQIREIPYFFDQTPWLLFLSLLVIVKLLFEGGVYFFENT